MQHHDLIHSGILISHRAFSADPDGAISFYIMYTDINFWLRPLNILLCYNACNVYIVTVQLKETNRPITS